MSPRKPKKLPRGFYARPTLDVAHDLVGKFLVYNGPQGRMSARIVEVEAYIGQDDPACHAARGKTNRNAVMFGPPGFIYIYFIYGMYYCLNFVTEPEHQPAAVLLRAAEPTEGLDLMSTNSPGKKPLDLLSGPGKLCRSFGLTVEQNGLDLTGKTIYLEDRHTPHPKVTNTTRIGINHAREKLWRFCDSDSNAVSK